MEVKRLSGSVGGSGDFIVETPEGSWRVSLVLSGAKRSATAIAPVAADTITADMVIAEVNRHQADEFNRVNMGRASVNRMDRGEHASNRRY